MTYQDLTQEQKERYNAYHKEYKKYYEDAQSDEERNEILRKLNELCQAEFGINSNSWWWVAMKDGDFGGYIEPLPYPDKKQQSKPTQDIKSLKIVVMVLAGIVVYLLMKKK